MSHVVESEKFAAILENVCSADHKSPNKDSCIRDTYKEYRRACDEEAREPKALSEWLPPLH